MINDYWCSVYLQGCNTTITLVCICSNYGKLNVEGWACSSGVEHLHSMNKTLASLPSMTTEIKRTVYSILQQHDASVML